MTTGLIDTQYYVYLLAWIVVPILLFLRFTRGGRLPGVLVFAYLAGFIMNHWLGALVHASPYSQLLNLDDTVSGFHLSTLGLFAFALGALLAGAVAPLRAKTLRGPDARLSNDKGELPPRLVATLLTIGIAVWMLSFTPVASLPSASAVLSTGRYCATFALCLLCWSAWQRGRMTAFWCWLATTFTLPVITIITQGFIGYGINMVIVVLIFLAMFVRPRWILLVGAFVIIYAGMTFWVAYFNHREEIRDAVWGGADYETRVSEFTVVLKSIEPFNFANPVHLVYINERLNQNHLVGAAIRTTPDFVPFAHGKTIYEAILAIIPRAIWPDKPIGAGSGDYVSKHTMIEFAEGISVGMGQVIEFYINFGVSGVLIGFVMLGAGLRLLDLRFVSAFKNRDFRKMTLYFVVGTGALQVGGSLVEVVAAMGGGAVLYLAAVQFIPRETRVQGSSGFKRDHATPRLSSSLANRPARAHAGLPGGR